MRITFKSDVKKRKKFFTPEAFAHPAKMHLGLLLWIVGKYTKEGETILDPMFGCGSTMLACWLGRNVIGVELEQKFVKMAQDNWGKLQALLCPNYPMGNCQIIQGDARQLEGLVDKIITSPPFAPGEATKIGKAGDKPQRTGDIRKNPRHEGEKLYFTPYQTAEHPDNIDNLRYGQIDKIVTSPPYEGSVAVPDSNQEARAERLKKEGYDPRDYQAGEGNIGNLKSDSYLEAMLQVYQQCHKVLKPQGLMILVTKDFIRKGQRILLSIDTMKLCESVGFVFEDWHERVLTQQSFWRVIYYQKHPEVERLETEDILVFRKPK